MTNSFVKRIEIERLFIKEINKHVHLYVKPLVGLSKQSVDRFFNESIDRNISEIKRKKLYKLLINASSVLRLASTASHRGAVISPIPSDQEVKKYLDKIRNILRNL